MPAYFMLLISYSAAGHTAESTRSVQGHPCTHATLGVVTRYSWLFLAWQRERCSSSVLLEYSWGCLIPAAPLELFVTWDPSLPCLTHRSLVVSPVCPVPCLTHRCLQECETFLPVTVGRQEGAWFSDYDRTSSCHNKDAIE